MKQFRLVYAAGILAALLALGGCQPREGDPDRVEPSTTVEVLRPLQLAPNAFLPEQDAQLLEVDVQDDRVVFTYSGPPTEAFEMDQVISGVRDGGYLRRVTGVTETSPNVYEVMTVHADLAELILDGHFIVHMRPGTEGYAEVDERGVVTAPLSGGWSLLSPEFRNIACGGGRSGSVSVTPSFDINMDADVEVDIRWTRRWLIVPRGDLRYARFVLSGDIEAGVSVNTTESTSFMCSYNMVSYLEGRGVRVPKREWATTFAVGPVPVVITHTIQPSLSLSLSGSIETGNTTARATGRIGLSAGTEYTEAGGWQAIWNPTRSGSAGLDAADPGSLTITFSAAGGIGYQAKLYDAIGPGASIGPSVSASFTVAADRCAWSAEVKAGVDASISGSLTVPVFDYTLAEMSISETLAETVIANPMGTFPWPTCQDGGMEMDAGMPTVRRDAGSVTPPRDGGVAPGTDGGAAAGDGGPGGGDAGTPSCSTEPNCGSCTNAGCEWCPGTGACGDAGSCGGGITSMAMCPACGIASALCDYDADCCDGFVCSAGGCRPESLCALREGASCSTTSECCRGLDCRPQTRGGPTSCCLVARTECDSDADCCGAMTCVSGQCRSRERGESCVTTAECVVGLCTDGTCT